MAQRVTANSRVGRPAPQKGGKPKPAPNVIGVAGQGPLLNSPVPVRSSRPKPTPKPKAQPRQGPPFKPSPKPAPTFKVPAEAKGKPPSQTDPVVDGHRQSYWKTHIGYASGATAPRGGSLTDSLGKVGKFLAGGEIAGNPLIGLEVNAATHGTNPRAAILAQANNTLGPDIVNAAQGRPFSDVGLGLGLAGLIPGLGEAGAPLEGIDHLAASEAAAKSIARDQAAGRGADEILGNARNAVKQSLQQGKNKQRVIFEPNSSHILQSVAGDVVGPKSRSGLLPHLQNAVDAITQHSLDKRPVGSPAYSRNPIANLNVSNLVKTRQHFIDQLERAVPETLKANNLSDAHRQALFMVAHDTPPSVLSKFFDQAIKEAKSERAVKDLTAQKALLEDSARLVREDNGRVVLHGTNAPRQLHQIAGWMTKTDAQRTQQARELGILNPETAAQRLSAPGRIMRGARYDENGNLVGAESFTGGNVYVPGRQNERVTGIGRARVSDVVTNRFRKPVGMQGEYRGQNLLSGRQDVNAPKLVGEAGLSMQRFFHRTQGLQHLQELATSFDAFPADLKHVQAVKLGDLTHSETVDLNNALAAIKQEQIPTQQAMRVVHKAFDHILTGPKGLLPPKAMSDLLKTDANYGFVWKPLAGAKSSYAPVNDLEHWLLDVPSGALKTAIVYTKLPGHIPARRFSNGFFNLAQMGPKLIPIAVKQLILNRRYPDWATHMQMLTGEGSLDAIASTKLQKTLTNVVRRWSDANPRRMAVYYELERVAGRSLNPDEAVALLKQMSEAPRESHLGQELINLTQRASVHAGDYSRMTEIEKRLVSKVLFLWAWHRTAAVTITKFGLEHPLTLGAVGAGTYYLNEKVNASQPPWDKFNVPLDRVGLPGKVANITTSFPASQPVQDIHALGNIGKPVFGQTLGGELNPFIATGLQELTGRNLETGAALKSRLGGITSLSSQIPPVALASGKAKLQDRIMKFVLGNEAPQTAPVAPNLGASLNKLVKGGKMSKSEAANITRQVNSLKARLPGIEAKVKEQMDKLVSEGKMTSKQEHATLKRLEDTIPNLEKRLQKAAG